MTLEQEVIFYKNMVKKYKFDYLTGMKQRRDFEHETLHKFASQKFYLTMYDVVGLHKVNRERGYSEGDALIRQVANDINMTDGLWEAYRVGGDEFMAIHFDQPDSDIKNATHATVWSGHYELFSKMTEAVDQMVTDKKSVLGRRRED